MSCNSCVAAMSLYRARKGTVSLGGIGKSSRPLTSNEGAETPFEDKYSLSIFVFSVIVADNSLIRSSAILKM